MQISWTLVSIMSRAASIIIGIVLSAYVLSYLTIYEQGIRGIVVGIVAMLGVMQNLGLSSGSTKEIAAAHTLKDAGKVFVVSLGIRYLLSIPVAIILIFGAHAFANFYNAPEIVLPLQIFGVVLLIQALQATLKSLVQGLHKFAFLFSHQVFLEALPSLFIHIYLMSIYGFMGFFYAQLASVVFSTVTMGIYSMFVMNGDFEVPNKYEFNKIFRSIFKIAVVVYAIKIIVTQWEQLGPLVIGKVGTPEQVAIFTVALFIAIKVVTISDAVTDVSLPRMSSIYEKARDKFESIFLAGNTKAFALILFGAVALIILKRDLIMIIDYFFGFLGKAPLTVRYAPSFRLVDLLVVAFWFYSQLNLFKSGISIPIGKPVQALIVFVELIVSSIIVTFISKSYVDLNLSIAIGMAVGGLISYAHYLYIVKKEMGFSVLQNNDIYYVIVSLLFLVVHYTVGHSVLVFSLFTLVSMYFMFTAFKRNES